MSQTATDPQLREGSGAMFDRIAGRYDFLNRVISLGQDQSWRRRQVRSLELGAEPCEVLDVATGTADVAIMIHGHHPNAKLVGLDPSAEMLAVGREKVAAKKLSEKIELVQGDAQAMPFEDNRFAACTISFGIRNVPDRLKGLREMHRVTRPGGRIAVLELNEPKNGITAPFARFFIHRIVPRIGAWLSGEREYEYLQRSIAAFPPPETFCDMMREAGWTEVKAQGLNFGSVMLFTGIKSQSPS